MFWFFLFLSPCTPRTPFPTMLYSFIWLKKTIQSRLVLFLGENKRRPIRCSHFWVFLCCVCFYQYCRLVHQKFIKSIGPSLMKSHVHFYFLFLLLWFLEESGPSSSSSGLFGTNSESVLCEHGHTQNVSAEKKPQKVEKKGIKEVVFVQILFFLSRQKILTLNEVDKE